MNTGLSVQYGAGFPVAVTPGTTYYIYGTFDNMGIYATFWKENGDYYTNEAYVLGDYSFTVPANCTTAVVIFRMDTRNVANSAKDVIMTDTPIT